MEIKKKQAAENAEKIITYDLKEKNIEIIDIEAPSYIRLVFSALISILFFVGSYFFFDGYKMGLKTESISDYRTFYSYMYGFYISLLLGVWFFVDAILVIVAISTYNGEEGEYNFMSASIIYNAFYIKTIATLLIFSLLLYVALGLKHEITIKKLQDANVIEPEIIEGKIKNEGEDKVKPERLFEHTTFEIDGDQFCKILLSCSFFILVYFLKLLMVQFINYRIHFLYYKERIDKNEKHMEYLQKLNRISGGRINTDLKTWASKVYSKIAKSGELTLQEFKTLFGDEDGKDMFELFDVDHNESVSREEFVKYYILLINEKRKLTTSLNDNDACLKKLDIILTCICVPVGLFISFIIIGQKESFTAAFSSIAGIFLPLSFVFGPVLSDMFKSILFIFAVRPFDTGDKITVAGNHYEVREIGLLYTTLIADSKFHNFPNSILRDAPVINLRRSSYITETYVLRFAFEDAEEKLKVLKLDISKFLKSNSKIFKEDFSVSDYEIIGGDTLKVEIKIKLACAHQDIKAAKERKDVFTLFLHERIISLGLVYRR